MVESKFWRSASDVHVGFLFDRQSILERREVDSQAPFSRHKKQIPSSVGEQRSSKREKQNRNRRAEGCSVDMTFNIRNMVFRVINQLGERCCYIESWKFFKNCVELKWKDFTGLLVSGQFTVSSLLNYLRYFLNILFDKKIDIV